MKPIDKFNRPIYSHVYSKMKEYAIILIANGFKESTKNDNLFWKRLEYGRIFADMRGTDIISIWDDTSPLVYVYPDENCQVPYWKRHRIAGEELDRLFKAGLKYRFSIEAQMEGDCVICRRRFCTGNAGFCVWCDKDFQGEDEYCSKECEQDHREHCKQLCAACGKGIDFGKEHLHHYSYFPPETIPVHQHCHLEIHNTDKYPNLKPPDGDSDRFYKKGEYAVERKKRVKSKKATPSAKESSSSPVPKPRRLLTFKRSAAEDRWQREMYKRKHGR